MTWILEKLGIIAAVERCGSCATQPKAPGYRFCRSCMHGWRGR